MAEDQKKVLEEKLVEEKLAELGLMHNYFLDNDVSYSIDCTVRKTGGINTIIKKWNNVIDGLFDQFTDADIKEELESAIPYNWDVFGVTYFDTDERYDSSENINKRPLSELVDIFRKLMPIIRELYKKYGYKKQSYGDPKTVYDNNFMFMSLRDKMAEITGFDFKDFSSNEIYYLSLKIRRVINYMLEKYKDEDTESEYDELLDILYSLYTRKKLK